MTTQLNSVVMAVLSDKTNAVLMSAGQQVWDGVNSVDNAHADILAVLNESAESLEHYNAVQNQVFKGMELGKGFSKGYAQNLWSDFMKFAKAEGYKKPQTAKAQALAEKREIEKSAIEKKYGSQSMDDLKNALVSASDSKTFDEITKAIKVRNNEVKKAEKANQSEWLKSAKKKINDLLSTNNPNHAENATQLLAFIKKQNLS